MQLQVGQRAMTVILPLPVNGVRPGTTPGVRPPIGRTAVPHWRRLGGLGGGGGLHSATNTMSRTAPIHTAMTCPLHVLHRSDINILSDAGEACPSCCQPGRGRDGLLTASLHDGCLDTAPRCRSAFAEEGVVCGKVRGEVVCREG